MQHIESATFTPVSKLSFFNRLLRDLRINKLVYLLALPGIIWYAVFHYAPMYGLIIAFKDFNPQLGILGSPWTGFSHFQNFFNSVFFWRILRNTLLISIYQIIFFFPAPIIFALLLNEIRKVAFKRTVQTISYLPHFISLVVVAGLIHDFTARNGLINDIIYFFGGERVHWLGQASAFRPIFIISDIWQGMGFGSIIFLAALSGINQELYESAVIDGAGRLRQTWHVTLPGILPTITILLVLRIGALMNVGFEKVILLYNPRVYETADVIASYVYRRGLLEFSFSYSAAVGMFNSVINFAMVISANWFARKFTGTSLW